MVVLKQAANDAGDANVGACDVQNDRKTNAKECRRCRYQQLER